MEQLILKHLQAAPEDLRALANQRATVVRNQLESAGKVPRERLFLVEPKLTTDDIKDKGAKTWTSSSNSSTGRLFRQGLTSAAAA